MRPNWILALSFLTAVTAQDTPPADATAKKAPTVAALEALQQADDAGRDAALIGFVDAQLKTGAVYSGQYAALAKLEWDVVLKLRAWMTTAPKAATSDAAMFRNGCVNALRDCVKTASDELIAELQALATHHGTPDRLAANAKYALAQFGKTEHVDKMIESAKAGTNAKDVRTKVQAWSQLADVYYNMRRYEEAAKAHRQVITTIEGVNPHFQGLPGSYYNCACSLALSGQKQAALEHLTKSLKLGKQVHSPMGRELLQNDMDIRSLRGEPEFAALMKEYFGIDTPGTATADKSGKSDKQESGKR